MDKIEIENKNYYIPTGATELSLEKFERVRKIIDENTISGVTPSLTYEMILDMVVAVTDIDRELILSSPTQFFDMLVEKLTWLFTLDLDKLPIQDFIIMGGEKYIYEGSPNITLHEWVDIDTIIKTFPFEDQFASILSVRLRKEIDGKIEKHNSDNIAMRKDKFKQCPVSEVIPIINFFLRNDKQLSILTELYSQMVELAIHKQSTLNELVINGDGTQRLRAWQRRIYSRSMKYLSKELLKHSTFLHTHLINQMPSTKITNYTSNN
jgi:hypothetical protein